MKFKESFAFLAVISVLAANSASAGSASNCFLNKQQDSCEESSICTWIKAYKASTGKSVKGYCRMAPEQSEKLAQNRLKQTNE